ncbi:hypothetical protein CC2G_012791 [Coprinopsis cinerea AmutBmut pab1-1]|nr:hypothetical protein CC2G_012791 [Coprinopsis cinerea AmutBmut pab1-1]
MGQLPVTCGLYFSLGHSTIVFVVTIAIAISVDVFNRLDSVSNVGGIIGPAVSGSFLFIVGLANSIILWRILRRRRKQKQQEQRNEEALEEVEGLHDSRKSEGMLMMRILGPVVNFVNRPWKMYPVGVLFGFGFDTASSIALISVSAIAKKQSEYGSFPSSYIIILPLLFTAGMVLLDSADSIIMLYSYTGFPERTWKLVTRKPAARAPAPAIPPPDAKEFSSKKSGVPETEKVVPTAEVLPVELDPSVGTALAVKTNVMSGLSIILTVLSIILAFSISLITIMSLIGERCSQCLAAAEAEDGGGLAGRWWRGWANAAEQSGWIGIGIVGGFILIVGGWYLARWFVSRRRGSKETNAPVVNTPETKGQLA